MRRKRRAQGEVELNLAAMLDMAFQLLTFFILTFKPAPVEGQLSLRLPPPQAIARVRGGQAAGSDMQNQNQVAGVESLVVSVLAAPDGRIGTLVIGEKPVGGLAGLDEGLKRFISDPSSQFDQVVIQVGAQLKYEELMQVLDVCSRQKLADGKPLTKLSFVEIPDSAAAQTAAR
jgi:biopolymer transport protein ExbD